MTRRTNTRSVFVASLAGVAACLLQLSVIREYAVNVPFWDEWDDLVGFVSKVQLGTARWADWVAPHMEHRIVVPRVGFWLVDAVFGNANLLGAMTVSAVLAGVIAAVWAYALRRLQAPIWLIGATIPIVGTIGQYENILWGFQIQFYSLVAGMLAAIVAVSVSRRVTWVVIATAAIGCMVSTYSMASGALSWIVVSMVLVLRQLVEWRSGAADRLVTGPMARRLAVFIAAGGLGSWLYFVGYTPAPGPAGDTFAAWTVSRYAIVWIWDIGLLCTGSRGLIRALRS